MHFKSDKLVAERDWVHHFRILLLTSNTKHKSLVPISNLDFISCWSGSNFLCVTHIIPVKNEEGVVMMFILNFDYILDEGSSDSLERLNHTSPSKADQRE